MRLSRKMTTYGKELYNWNFFKTMKGYKLNPSGNWDNLATRVNFGFFDNEPNTKLSEKISALQIYILKESDCNFDNMPVYYDQGPTYRNLEWPNETRKAYEKSRSDYKKIQDNYLYKIEIVNNEELMITGKNSNNLSESQYLDLSSIDLPTNECLHYQVIICTLEYLDNISSGCYTPSSVFKGQYYTAYVNTIFVDNNVPTQYCFRSWTSSTQDYELQMLSYSNEIQYIPTKEMVVYNTITNVAAYSDRVRYELPNGEDIFCAAVPTEPNKSWYYAYNISKAETPLCILGDNTNTGFSDSTTLKKGGFKPWFTINIINTNEPFYVYLTLNNKRYRFLNGLKKSDLCERSEEGTNISAAFKYGESSEENNTREANERDPENPVIYKNLPAGGGGYYRACFCTFKGTGYSPSDTNLVLEEYSIWCRNELIPTVLSDSNCNITEISSPLFYRKKDTSYNRGKSYQSATFDPLTGLVVNPNTATWKDNGGCILMFEYFDDNPNAIKVFVLADNENDETIAGSSIFDNDISETKYTMPTFDYPDDNGKIVGDNVYSPVNYITGDSLQPSSQNGGN